MNDRQRKLANIADVRFDQYAHIADTYVVRAEVENWVEHGQTISAQSAKAIASWWMTPRKADLLSAMAHGGNFDAFEGIAAIKAEMATTDSAADLLDLSALIGAIAALMGDQIIQLAGEEIED